MVVYFLFFCLAFYFDSVSKAKNAPAAKSGADRTKPSKLILHIPTKVDKNLSLLLFKLKYCCPP